MENFKPVNLHSRLRAVWRRSQLLNLLSGLLALWNWVIILFLACLGTDWLVHLSAPLRFTALGALVTVAVYRSWRNGWRYFTAFDLTRCALKIENHYRNLESLIVTGAQLGAGKLSPGTSAFMTETAVKNADRAVIPLKAREIAPFDKLQKPAMLAAPLLTAIIILAAVNLPLLKVGLGRIFTPWRQITYPTNTQIKLNQQEIIVKEGDSVGILAQFFGEVPDSAKLALRTGKGKPHIRTLKITNGACEYNMTAAFRSFDYSVSAGDARSAWHAVKVITSPRIEKTQIRLDYPDYMNRSPETVDSMTMTVPEGAAIEWDLQLDRPVSDATFKAEDGQPTPLTVSENGLTLQHKLSVNASRAYSFTWTEKKHGFSFDSPKYYLQVAPDAAPQIELTSPKKNLYATIGRKLDLTYRVRDDHGVGESKIIYRHNNAEEKQIAFSPKISEGRNVQNIDWDYRSALKDLSVGDSVTIAIKVSDSYPPPGGPHRVRSQSRRVSFLTREDYLVKINGQKDRLLSQLRSVYRQERSACDVIKNLDPADDAFEQTCFLESSRQDIINERITALVGGIQELTDDLIANNITEESEHSGLRKLQAGLIYITDNLVRQGALQLSDLDSSQVGVTHDVARATETVNAAARELGSLVILLGVNQAMEVFARELHVIAGMQSGLRLDTLNANDDNATLAQNQQDLQKWFDRLLTELGKDRNYAKPPLVIVRLARMVKDIRNAAIEQTMSEAASLLADGKLVGAVALQDEIIRQIFQFECFVRVGAEYEALIKTRELFTLGINQLRQMSVDNDKMSVRQFDSSQAEMADALSGLYTDLRLLIIPDVPAPTSKLLEEKPTDAPLVEQLTNSAHDSLLESVKAIHAKHREESFSRQRRAEQIFVKLNEIIARRIEDITRTARYASCSNEAESQISIIRELLSSQLRLVEKTEDADYDGVSGAYLAPSQKYLSKTVESVKRRLQRNSKNSSAAKLAGPMPELLDNAAEAMLKASPALAANKLDKALKHQDVVLDSLEQAVGLARQESGGWIGLANLLITAEAASLPVKYMNDAISQQQGLVEQTKNSSPPTRARLVRMQNVLCRAVSDIALLLDAAGASVDFEQAITFAASDMGASALHLENGRIAEAMESQAFAAESLLDLANQLKTSQRQYYFFVNVLEFVQEAIINVSVTQIKLKQLRMEMENTDAEDLLPYLERLQPLHKNLETLDELLYRAVGREDYAAPHKHTEVAVKELKAGQFDACLDELINAEDSLTANLEELRELIMHIGSIPEVIPAEAPKEYNVMMNAVTLLLELKDLANETYRAKPEKLSGFESRLSEIQGICKNLINETQQHTFVIEADKFLARTAELLKKSTGSQAYRTLRKADAKLRHCILEYALYYIEPPRRSGAKRRKKAKSGIISIFKLSAKLKPAYDKDWGGVEGDESKSGRTDWEVLGNRDRAALNENFVRELPLEYREILKDYYERLTK